MKKKQIQILQPNERFFSLGHELLFPEMRQAYNLTGLALVVEKCIYKNMLQTANISPISLIKSLASSDGSTQTAGVGCRAAKMTLNCR